MGSSRFQIFLFTSSYYSPPRYGASTKAAIIRIGLLEMWQFIKLYFGGHDMQTLLESCGVADLIATCSGGRNRKVSEAFVTTGKVGLCVCACACIGCQWDL